MLLRFTRAGALASSFNILRWLFSADEFELHQLEAICF